MKKNEENMLDTRGDWELKKRGLQTARNFNLLLNRINVLTKERDSKLKSIENQMERHREFIVKKVENDMQRKQLREKVKQSTNPLLNFSLSRVARDTQRMNLSRIRQTMQTSWVNNVEKSKEEMKELKALRKEEQRRIQEQNSKKRNIIRLKEIQGKEKIGRFWSTKLQNLKMQKQFRMRQTLDTLNCSQSKISILENDQARLLRQLEKTDTIMGQLSQLMKHEKSLEAQRLATKYRLWQDSQSQTSFKFKRLGDV